VIAPPRAFIAGLVQLPMMPAAQGDREFIAHLEANRSRLGESEMVWVRWLPLADHARLGRYESQMCSVAQPLRFGDSELTFINATGTRA
jgi:hypothetical protein